VAAMREARHSDDASVSSAKNELLFRLGEKTTSAQGFYAHCSRFIKGPNKVKNPNVHPLRPRQGKKIKKTFKKWRLYLLKTT